ncbi:MAG: type II toxin-antitoxin system HicA family toxin [Candidatus Micrarchaeota archaeon]
MSGLRPIKAQRLIKILAALGFSQVRRHGSHVFLRHPDGRTTTVPVHAREEIDRHLLRKILKDAELAPAEFLKLA